LIYIARNEKKRRGYVIREDDEDENENEDEDENKNVNVEAGEEDITEDD
jgi:hypothetical protein